MEAAAIWRPDRASDAPPPAPDGSPAGREGAVALTGIAMRASYHMVRNSFMRLVPWRGIHLSGARGAAGGMRDRVGGVAGAARAAGERGGAVVAWEVVRLGSSEGFRLTGATCFGVWSKTGYRPAGGE